MKTHPNEEAPMRHVVFALCSMLALTGCGQSQPPPAPVPQASAFPSLTQASFRLEGTVSKDGQAAPLAMVRDGLKMRIEVNAGEGPAVIINDGASGETLLLANIGGRQVALAAMPPPPASIPPKPGARTSPPTPRAPAIAPSPARPALNGPKPARRNRSASPPTASS
jgi:hypothetical protein